MVGINFCLMLGIFYIGIEKLQFNILPVALMATCVGLGARTWMFNFLEIDKQAEQLTKPSE